MHIYDWYIQCNGQEILYSYIIYNISLYFLERTDHNDTYNVYLILIYEVEINLICHLCRFL